MIAFTIVKYPILLSCAICLFVYLADSSGVFLKIGPFAGLATKVVSGRTYFDRVGFA